MPNINTRLMNKVEIQLFVTGRSVKADTAIDNLRALLAEASADDFNLTIIDVLEDPQAAEDAFILATPTLIKTAPLPVRRTIGDLSDRESLIRGLDLKVFQKA